jgi:phage major head subunit gpT-like protein
MQINQATLSALFKGYKTQFLENYIAGKPLWPNIAMRTSSSAAEELYFWLGSISGMAEFTGKSIIDNLTASKYSIANREFQKIIAVKRADIERDSYGLYNPRMQMLGAVAAKHPDLLVANLLINGFTQLDYTGTPFFSANKVQDPGGPTTLTNNGTDKLSPMSFQKARAAIKSVKNSNGIPTDIGDELQLVVAPALETVGKQILEADFIMQTAQAAGANVGAAAISNVNKNAAKLVVWSQLAAAPAQWYILATGMPLKPLMVQEEKPVEFTSLVNLDDAHVFLQNEFLYKAYGRYNAGYGLPQLAWGSNGTTTPADYTGP